jgi:hypothetical protein
MVEAVSWIRPCQTVFPYEQESIWSASLDQRRSWTEQLEKTGITDVKFKLAQSAHGSHSSIATGAEVAVTKGFAEERTGWHDC